MKKDRTTIIFLIIALVGFILIKVVPLVYAPAITHETGRIKVKKDSLTVNPTRFVKEGNAWFQSNDNDTLVFFDIEIADSLSKISNGLQGHARIHENQGMLFVFTEESSKSFRMKKNRFPIDLIYIRKNGTIDSFYKNTKPDSIKPLPSSGKVLYVLEVKGGFIDLHEITKASKFDYNKLQK